MDDKDKISKNKTIIKALSRILTEIIEENQQNTNINGIN
jgi:hypothetical protein